MNEVKVSREELVGKLTANRTKHREIFLDAQEGYREQAIIELDKMLAEAKSGKKIRRAVVLTEPMDQTADYDRAIAMLEMSVDQHIQLSETDFACYVMDEWSWKRQFSMSNMGYTKHNHD